MSIICRRTELVFEEPNELNELLEGFFGPAPEILSVTNFPYPIQRLDLVLQFKTIVDAKVYLKHVAEKLGARFKKISMALRNSKDLPDKNPVFIMRGCQLVTIHGHNHDQPGIANLEFYYEYFEAIDSGKTPQTSFPLETTSFSLDGDGVFSQTPEISGEYNNILWKRNISNSPWKW